jgi:hypothetical protein
VSDVLVGLLDSGVADDLRARVTAERVRARPGRRRRATGRDRGCRRSRILDGAYDPRATPAARIVNAQVFHDSITAPPAVLAALAWVVEQGVRVVNRASASGRTVKCCGWRARQLERRSAAVRRHARRGPRVFRLVPWRRANLRRRARAADEGALLASAQADFGACPATIDERVRGASAATARITGKVAAFLAERPDADGASIARFLESIARYRGPERRAAHA